MRTRIRPFLTTDELLGSLPNGAAVVRDGARTVIGLAPSQTIRADGPDAFVALDTMTTGWWAGFISYDLGRSVERVPSNNRPLSIPDVAFARFETRIVIDPDDRWTIEGDVDALETLDSEPRSETIPALGPWTSSLDERDYMSAVAAIHDHLITGDCYQVNLTRRLVSHGQVDATSLFRALRAHNPAPHEALVPIGDTTVVSASPECFLRVNGRRVVTRPIKGTSSDAKVLRSSAKDRAENVMIVDLARNDLGRVCEYGSIHVPEMFGVESHPGLYHLVSTIEGVLRPDVTPSQLIRATFPPASVTGCPKPSVLQIIEELEPVRRGVYCGAVGFVDANRSIVDLNVAIRTFTITGEQTTFGVGAGIVADSDPAAEWEETELKARRLLRVASGG
jgi:para-aminobenzoate synthetase component 1